MHPTASNRANMCCLWYVICIYVITTFLCLDLLISVSLLGIVNGFNFVPAISLIPRYFQRYRSRASVLPFCGVSVANIVGPFIVRVVREEYGIGGVYIILSAVELHYCLAGLLLRPVSAYRYVPGFFATYCGSPSL